MVALVEPAENENPSARSANADPGGMIYETALHNAVSKLRERFNRQSAFTLVELLVVILIIGILLAIALPTFLNQQNKAQDTGTKSELNTGYKVAVSDAVSNGGTFPSPAAVADAIHKSEPELTAAPITDLSNATKGTVGVLTASNGNLELAEVSPAGHQCTLTVTNHATTGPTCDDGSGTGGSGGTGDTGGSGSPAGDLTMVAQSWDPDRGAIIDRFLSGSSTSLDTNVLATDNTEDPGVFQSYQYVQGGFVYSINLASGGNVGDLENLDKTDLSTGNMSEVTPSRSFCGGAGLNAPNGGANGIVPAGSGRLVMVCTDGFSISEADEDGGNQQTIVSGGWDNYLAVASNGSQIVYVQNDGDTSSLWTVPVSGGTPTQVAGVNAYIDQVAISSNNTIAFTAYQYGVGEDQLYTVPASGGTPQQLTSDSTYAANSPQFSPDGSKIAYSQVNFYAGGSEIAVIPTGGGTPTVVTDEGNGGSGFGVPYVFWTS